MAKRRGSWLPVFAMVAGVGLMVWGANEAFRAYRYDQAAQELRSIFADATVSRSRKDEAAPSRFVIVDKFTAQIDREAGPRESIPEDEIPRLRLGAEALLPTDQFVRAVAADSTIDLATGSGTREDPWIGLQSALEKLAPGDRLIVLNGQYRDTYRIAETAANGTPENPITVYFASDALIAGSAPGTCVNDMLTVARSYWIFEGLNMTPQGCPAGVRVVGNVRSVTFNSLHISGAAMDGVVVEGSATGVALNNAHLHQLGTLEGKDPATRGTTKTPEDSQFAAIRAQLGSVELSGGKMHNIFGTPLKLTDVNGKTVSGEELLMLTTRWGVSVNEGQAKWW